MRRISTVVMPYSCTSIFGIMLLLAVVAVTPFRDLNFLGLPQTGQSPIDLDDSIVVPKNYPPLMLCGHWLNDGEAIMTNGGTYPKITLSGNRIPSTISGGPLNNDLFEFYGGHFHWGEDDCRGSEHTINGTWFRHSFSFVFPFVQVLTNHKLQLHYYLVLHGNRFSMEFHAVHWNRKYGTFDECLNHTDGLCVLAYLFLITKEPSSADAKLDKITDYLKFILEEGSKVEISANCLCWMRAATHCQHYYTYNGSYNAGTNPECAIWIVFPVILPVRRDQLASFRRLKGCNGECTKANCRTTQLLRGRKIFWAC